jgi:thiamine-phosphate pyrophosphorylase
LNDRADLALSLGFAGVHLREDSLPLAQHAPVLRERLRFGVSCHSVEGVVAAQAAGAAFATFGPVFETASKAAYGAPVGLKLLEQAAARTTLPLFALGGVTPERVRACREAGAWGVAAISAVWDADDPVAALQRFGDALGGL